MELDSKILAYVAYRAARSALINQLSETRLTIDSLTEVIKRLNISAETKVGIDEFFKLAQLDFGRMLKESFEKVKRDTLATAKNYLKNEDDGKPQKEES